MAGYSNKTLSQKLGIKQGDKVILLNHPENYGHLLFPFPDNTSVFDTLSINADFIQFFTKSRSELEDHFVNLKKSLKPDGMLWVSWPKKTSKISTDLNENVIREIALKNGLVDIKVVAVDDAWSGLKLVYRLKDRK